MAQMNHNDWAVMIDALYSAAADPTQWPAVITLLAEHVGAHAGMLVRNAADPELSSCVLGGLRPEISEVYVRDYTDNPWTRAAEAVPIGEVAVLSSLYDLREGRHLPWYADILVPTHTHDMAYLSLPGFTGPRSVGGLALCFSEAAADRNIHQAAQRLRELRPHLQRAVWLSQHVEQARILQQRLDDLVHATPHPVLLLSGAHRVVGMNSAAETLLREANGLTIDHSGRLRTVSPKDNAALHAAIVRTVTLTADPPTVTVDRPSRIPLRLLLSPLPGSNALPAVDPEAEAVVLITVIDPVSPQHNKLRALSTIYGLTNAEARVAILLATGAGRDTAATRLDVSIETVKKHTAACFRKIGVSSQAGLAHVVATLPNHRSQSGRSDR
jgi:DNA-binding CsgD family transcriptional regulator